MIPPYNIAPDGTTYVPSLVAPNQILFVQKAQGQTSPLSPRDLYFLQRIHIPIGQTWAVFGSNPPSAHFVQMGMLPPLQPTYATVLMTPQEINRAPQFQQQPTPPPAPPSNPDSELWDATAYEAFSDTGVKEQ